MESNIKADFIPDNMAGEKGRGPGRGAPSGGGSAVDIFVLLGVVALAAALALAAGVFLYDRFLDTNAQRKGEQLARAQQAFEPELIRELIRLDARLQASDDILARHLAPSELFNLLEELTLQSVSYESLNYSVNEDESIRITMKGKARSVNGVALQASVFGQHNAVTNPIFSDLDFVSDGVTFQVSAIVNPSAIRYTNVFTQYSGGIETSLEADGGFGGEFGGEFDSSVQDFGAAAEIQEEGAQQEEGTFGEFGAQDETSGEVEEQ